MKRRLLSLILFLVCLATTAQNKPGFKESETACKFAEKYLEKKGATSGKIDLALEEYTDRLLFFNDIKNRQFLLMAREKYASLLTDRVLAFSIGPHHGKAKSIYTFMRIMKYYDQLISDMYSGKEHSELSSDVDTLRRMPMLYGIKWCQFDMANVFDGQKDLVLSGCGPVAMGQLMRGYQWPKTVKGDFCYKDTCGNIISTNMNGTQIDWDKIHPTYTRHDGEQSTVEPLLIMLGKATCAKYGTKETGTEGLSYKRALVQNFGYSPAMRYVSNLDVDETTIVSLIRAELKAKRPCILEGGKHAFVCDGAYGSFLHLIMGWAGAYDGWYRFPVVRRRINPASFIRRILINITPLTEQGISKSITVETPGTLPDLLTEDECKHITSLTIDGRLNGKDIQLLRRMAGAIDSTNCFSWRGMLQNLDLANATIVKDTIPYAVFNAKNILFSVRDKKKHYDFSNITDAEWQEFCNVYRDNKKEWRVCREDTIYYVKYLTHTNTIGTRMFDRCDNLQRIILPKKLLIIQPSAFTRCTCLDSITIPSAVLSLPQYCFKGCRSLQSVKVCPGSPILSLRESSNQWKLMNIFDSCHPYLSITVDDSMESFEEAKKRVMQNWSKEKKAAFIKKEKEKADKAETSNALSEGKTVIHHYKMVKGKKVLIGKEIK